MWLTLVAAVVASADPVLIPQMGPIGGPTAAAFSRDGRWLATGDSQGKIQVWDIATGAQFGALSGHERDVTSLDFSPDGVVLVSAAEDEVVNVWDVVGGELIAELPTGDDTEGPAAFSPDGQHVAVAADHGYSVALWDAEGAVAVQSYETDRTSMRELRFSDDGGQLLGVGPNRAIIWDTTTGEPVRTLESHHFSFASAAMVDGLVAVGVDRVLRLHDSAGGAPSAPIRMGQGYSAALSSDGKTAAIGQRDGSIILADASTGEWLRQVAGHDRRVTAVAFSPDAGVLASCGDDEVTLLWDVATGERLRELRGHEDGISAVAFSPDGALVATASDSRDEIVCRLSECGLVETLAFSPGGDRLAAGTNSRLRVHDPRTGALLWEDTVHTDDVRAIAFTPDGSTVASADQDARVLLSVAATGEVVREFDLPEGPASHLAFSDDGSELSVARHQRESHWSVATGRMLREAELVGVSPLAFHGGGVLGSSSRVVVQSEPGAIRPLPDPTLAPRSVCISPDGLTLAVAGQGGGTRLRDLTTGETLRDLEGLSLEMNGPAAFAPDSRRLMVRSQDGYGQLVDIGTGEASRTFTGRWTRPYMALLSPDGRRLVTTTSDGGAHLWDLPALNMARMWGGETDFLLPMAFSPDSRTLVMKRTERDEDEDGQQGEIRQCLVFTDVESGEMTREFGVPRLMSRTVAFSPDLKRFASGAQGGMVMYDLESGEELLRVEREIPRYRMSMTNGAGGVAFSPDGRLLASADSDHKITTWDVETGEKQVVFADPEEGTSHAFGINVGALVFSPDGTQLACLRRSTLYLYDAATGELQATIKDDDWWMTDVAYTPDGAALITPTQGGQIVFWDPATGRPEAMLGGHTGEVGPISLSGDGRLLASASHDGTVRLWDVAQMAPLATLWVIGMPRYRYYPPGGGSTYRSETSKLWAAWTPEGIYDCAEGAEEFIWFRDDDGSMHPSTDFADRFRKPEALAAAIAN